jgi:hypothetical protein
MWDVPEEVKKKRRWVDDYVATLDPDTEYDRIIGVMAEYQMDDFALRMVISSANLHFVMPAHGAEAQVFTNKALRKPNLRMQDTTDYFWTWVTTGSDSQETKDALRQLYNHHMGVAKHLPGHFSLSSDYVYPLCLLATFRNRLRKRLGLGEEPDHIKRATANWYHTFASHWWREGDLRREGMPETFEGMEAYVEDWEHWDHAYTPVQTDLANALIDQFAEKNLPKRLRFLGRWLIRYQIVDPVAEHFRLKPMPWFAKGITHLTLKAMMYASIHFKPDNKVSAYKAREQLSKPDLRDLDKVSTKRADKFGWSKGGHAAVGHADKVSPINENAVSMCPVVHIPADKTEAAE